MRDIRARGYDVWDHHVDITGFQHPNLPPGVLLHSIIIGRVILLLAECEEGSSSSGALDQSSEGVYYYDSDNVDSDTGERGRLKRHHNPDAEHEDSDN